MNIFEQASRSKLRFITGRGEWTVEQLWDLPLQSRNNACLDEVAIGLDTRIRSTEQKSFVNTGNNSASEELVLGLEIVKHIIEVKKAEAKAKSEAAEIDAKRKILDDKIAELKGAELISGSLEELQARRAELG